jgi:uncharacterized protein
MKIIRLIFWICAFMMLNTLICSCRENKTETGDESPVSGTVFRKDGTLSISSADGNLKGEFDIEIAATEKASMQGLMYRESMDKNQGMLFDPQGLTKTPFWMKNTYIALDIIFIDNDKKIMHIEENTHPYSEQTLDPEGVYRYALEINAGLSKQLEIKIGDKVSWQTGK